MPFGETIVASATPHGESAIAIVRASGPACLEIARSCYRFKKEIRARENNYGKYNSLVDTILDDTMWAYYEGSASYTGEDMLEIASHGNPFIVKQIIADLLLRGCRLAQAGEFTRTAFLNGKLDLSQAEAVADIVSARSEKAIRIAHQQLHGSLGKRIDEFSQALVGVIAQLEAFIDFPEDDLPQEELSLIIEALGGMSDSLLKLIETAEFRSVLESGIKTVIVGEPNAGKSSLLNFLLGEERAIVSSQPGTTRDYIEARAIIGDNAFLFTDTAGIHAVDDQIEALGIEKTIENVNIADFFLVVIDSALPCPIFPDNILKAFSPSNTLVIENKIDLEAARPKHSFLAECPRYRLSLKTGEALGGLREAIAECVQDDRIAAGSDSIVINARHATALREAYGAVRIARQEIEKSLATELACAQLRVALDALGEVVGRIDNEAVLDKLFSSFCIGK